MLHLVKISLLCVPSWKITPFLQLLYNDMADTLHIFIKPYTFFTRSHTTLHDHLTDPLCSWTYTPPSYTLAASEKL